MELQLRAPKSRFHPVSRSHRIGMGETCQWPQPGVPMYYPACEGTPPGTPETDPYERDVYSAYDVPGLIIPSMGDCTDWNTGVIDFDCVAKNAEIQQLNFARIARYNSDPAFAASFWPSYTPPAPPVYVPPAPTTTPVVYTAAPAPTPAPLPAPAPQQQSQPAAGSGTAASLFGGSVSVAGMDIPMVALLGGAAVILFLFMGRK